MIILIGVLALFLILWLYNIKRRALLHFEYQHKIQILREELKQYAFNNPDSTDSWAFAYLDKSLRNAHYNLKFFNYYVAWGLNALYAKDKYVSSFVFKLTAELDIPANRILKDIYYRFGYVLVEYVTKKHEFFSLVFLKLHSIQVHRNNRDRQKPQSQIINKIRDLRIYQDTSTLRKFV